MAVEAFVRDNGKWRPATPNEVATAPFFEVWLIEDGVDTPPAFVTCVFRAETRQRAERVAWACGANVAVVVPNSVQPA